MVSPCYCVVCAVRLQFKILWQGYIEKNKKNFMFYQRHITRRYFTESWKKFMGLCHSHRRLYRRTITRRYFTENCKKIYEIVPHSPTALPTDHNPSVFHRELQKIYGIVPQSPPVYRRRYRRPILTESPTDLDTSRSARMSDTCPSAQIPTALPTSNTDGFTHISKRTHV
jgi:hypothetical protein